MAVILVNWDCCVSMCGRMWGRIEMNKKVAILMGVGFTVRHVLTMVFRVLMDDRDME